MLAIIVAYDIKYGISKEGKIPWDIIQDRNYFVDVTTYKYNDNKNVLIVGKNTYLTMKEIKDRHIIVVSSTLKNDSIPQAKTLNDAIKKAKLLNPGRIFICGGRQLYKEALTEFKIDELYLTSISQDYNCDNNINFLHKHLDENEYTSNNLFMTYKSLFVESEIKKGISIKIAYYKNLENMTYNKTINIEEDKYLNMLYEILDNKSLFEGRNGQTKSLFGKNLEFDVSKAFPLLTTKKVFFEGVFKELLFFLKGDTNTKHLMDQKVNIWTYNTSKEFLDKSNLNYDEYDMGPMYGFNLIHYGEEYKGMDHKYNGYNQLEYCINLLKTDPFSRRILMTTYNPAQAKEGVLYPCHGISIIFNVDANKDFNYSLSCMMTQRSADMCCGVPFNIASYALLMHLMCTVINNDSKYVGKKFSPGRLIMNFGNAHIYKEHFSNAIRQISRQPYSFPQIKINKKTDVITDFVFEDIELINYVSYGNLNYKMIA
jgi:thymidylate synthase